MIPESTTILSSINTKQNDLEQKHLQIKSKSKRTSAPFTLPSSSSNSYKTQRGRMCFKRVLMNSNNINVIASPNVIELPNANKREIITISSSSSDDSNDEQNNINDIDHEQNHKNQHENENEIENENKNKNSNSISSSHIECSHSTSRIQSRSRSQQRLNSGALPARNIDKLNFHSSKLLLFNSRSNSDSSSTSASDRDRDRINENPVFNEVNKMKKMINELSTSFNQFFDSSQVPDCTWAHSIIEPISTSNSNSTSRSNSNSHVQIQDSAAQVQHIHPSDLQFNIDQIQFQQHIQSHPLLEKEYTQQDYYKLQIIYNTLLSKYKLTRAKYESMITIIRAHKKMESLMHALDKNISPAIVNDIQNVVTSS
jgi:epidermal growth factor receptor substrate 15